MAIWYPADVEELKRRYKNGETIGGIAKDMKRTKGQVSGKVRELVKEGQLPARIQANAEVEIPPPMPAIIIQPSDAPLVEPADLPDEEPDEEGFMPRPLQNRFRHSNITDHCRWPRWGASGGAFKWENNNGHDRPTGDESVDFCQEKHIAGKPYCDEHMKMAFRPGE